MGCGHPVHSAQRLLFVLQLLRVFAPGRTRPEWLATSCCAETTVLEAKPHLQRDATVGPGQHVDDVLGLDKVSEARRLAGGRVAP